MLKPALAYRVELEHKFAEEIYSERYYYYIGHPHIHQLPQIDDTNDCYRWAIVDDDKVVGFLSYYIDGLLDSVTSFGLYSFDEGNPVVGIDLFNELERLVKLYHRIEWRVIEGNPVIRHYDKFCEMHGGNKVTLHDCTKSMSGEYRDEYIYEILSPKGDQ